MIKVAFIDRDGTIIEEPADEQVDALNKVRFVPGAFLALKTLLAHGYELVMVTNQDGLGSANYPESSFREVQNFVVDSFASQGVVFSEVFVCSHRSGDGCTCRKPSVGLVETWLRSHELDKERSVVVGDRETDLEFARNLEVRGFRLQGDGATWPTITSEILARKSKVSRITKETAVDVSVSLDERAPVSAKTGIGFFDHMLEQLASHGGFSMTISCRGDLHIDEHHTVEDTALALGECLRLAIGEKRGLERFGFVVPMDESLAEVALDLSGRTFASFDGRFNREVVGGLPTELVPHFFRSLANSLGAALHISVKGDNSHHQVEACFKAVGRSLRMALRRDGFEVPSTKGVL